MPAGRVSRCEKCYWVALAKKRLDIACEVFSANDQAILFRKFGQWLCNEVGTNKAAITIAKHLPFFIDLATFEVTMPSYAQLLQRHSVLGLRRNEIPMRFLEHTGRVVIDENQKREAANQRGIEKILARAPASGVAKDAFDRYHVTLQQKMAESKTTSLSIRLALSPIAALLNMSAAAGHPLPTQAIVEKYLTNTPGQRAALSGFIHFVSAQYGISLRIPSRASAKVKFAVRRRLERDIANQLLSNASEPTARIALLTNSLQYFHYLSAKVAKRIAPVCLLIITEDGYVVATHNGIKYPMPRELSAQLLLKS